MISFPSLPNPNYGGGCTLEPAAFALDFLVQWRADVKVNGQVFENAVVLDLLREVERAPGKYGVTSEEAQQAKARFLAQGEQVLEREGGSAAWLEREFRRAG